MPRLLERIGDDARATATPPHLPAGPVDDVEVELSCTTAASSSSVSTPTDGTQQQQQLVSPPAPPATSAFGESAPSGYDGSYSSYSNTGTMWDTLCQPPQTDYHPTTAHLEAAACSWSDESLLAPGLSLPYGDMGMVGLPELADTMWGAGADDLWYTQIMGL